MEFTQATSFECRKVVKSLDIGEEFVPRIYGSSAILVGHRVYLLGCYNDIMRGRESSKLRILDSRKRVWTEFGIPERAMRSGACTFLWNDYIYVYSGRRGEWVDSSCFRVHLLADCAVEFIEPPLEGLSYVKLEGRSSSFCEPVRELVMFSGVSLRNQASDVTICMRVDTGAFYAPKLKGKRPSPRYSHCSCSVRNRVYIYGGTNGRAVFSEIYILTMAAGRHTWSHFATKISAKPVNAVMVAVPGKLLIVGGTQRRSGGKNQAPICIFSLTTQRCAQISTKPDSVGIRGDIILKNQIPDFSGHSMVVTKDRLLVFGGFTYWNAENTTYHEIVAGSQ